MGIRIGLGVAAIVFLAGCVTSRSEVDISGAHPSHALGVSVSNGKKVAIIAADERDFQIKPRSADIPSLKNDEITDKSITERAIARKRDGFGKAYGDVLLPSGLTVSGVVSEAVASAYRQAGYEVVSDPGASDVAKVKVHIVEFWGWLSPGFFSVAVNNKSCLRIETGGAADLKVVTRKRESMQVVTETDWKEITEAGLKEITQEIFKQL
ncbi:flagellar biosynthesis protein [Pseudomonas helleri]|uniref:flagellar biosynthesis protein n=1 Tax=Pseudomonas helleri TaxID=1608996 RepID=UPI003FD512EB